MGLRYREIWLGRDAGARQRGHGRDGLRARNFRAVRGQGAGSAAAAPVPGVGGGLSPAALGGDGAALGNSGHPAAFRGRLGPGSLCPPGGYGAGPDSQSDGGGGGDGERGRPGGWGRLAGLRLQPGSAAPLRAAGRGSGGSRKRRRMSRAGGSKNRVCAGAGEMRCSACPFRSPPPRARCPSRRRGLASLAVGARRPVPPAPTASSCPSAAPQVRERAFVRG